jgi:aminoglycoside phosphotransferase (APT) family kinase protein
MTGFDDLVDRDALAGWMTRQGLGEGPVEGVTLLAGGTQNILLKFTRAHRAYVLRRPPRCPRDNSNETMRREARILRALANTNVPHPRLIADSPGDDVLGTAFYLMEPIEGFNATVGLPTLHAAAGFVRREMGFSLVDAAVALADVDYVAVGLSGFGRPEHFLERQVSRWQRQLHSYAAYPDWPGPAAIPGVDAVARWLELHRPDRFVPGIIHGDFHIGNAMYRFDGPAVAAIVDWELATIGDPLLDLGWLLATWPDSDSPPEKFSVTPWDGFPSAEDLVARYAAASPRDLAHIEWYVVLACYKLGIILEGTFARARAGQAPRETGERLHARTIALFERALRKIA